MTPLNADAAEVLLMLVPTMRLIYTVRDGRDVACSLARLPWGPRTIEEGILYWANRLRHCERELNGVPQNQVHTIYLEQLVLNDRDESFDRLLRFLSLEREESMREFFDKEITVGKANLGRWRAELTPARARAVNALFRRTLRKLTDEGLCRLPPVYGTHGDGCWRVPPPGERSLADPWADGRAADA